MHSIERRRLSAQLKRDEGTVRDAAGNHVVYRCAAGASTIGYGHNLDAAPVPGIGESISDDQAERLLEADVFAVCESLEAKIRWARALDPARYAVLANMAFNLGIDGLLQFKNMLSFLRVGDFRNAAKEMRRSKWAAQVGRRAERLALQMETGIWR